MVTFRFRCIVGAPFENVEVRLDIVNRVTSHLKRQRAGTPVQA